MTDEDQAQIARISEISHMARTTWFGLLAYLAFVGITLLGVEDADFFVPSRQTELPLVGVSIPTASFFWFAPILGAALYTYLHLQLIKLWQALADAPAEADGRLLSERVYPWLVSDFALAHRICPLQRRPLRRLSYLVTLALVFWGGPLVLAGFWWRSMPAHDERMTLFIALCLSVAVYVGGTSWWSVHHDLRRDRAPWQGLWRRAVGWLALLLVVASSWLRTEAGLDHYAIRLIALYEATTRTALFQDKVYPSGRRKPAVMVREEWVKDHPLIPDLGTFTFDSRTPILGRWIDENETWTVLAATDLRGVDLAGRPIDWRDHNTSRRHFRAEWCRRQGLAPEVCWQRSSAQEPVPDRVAAVRAGWCDERQLGQASCAEEFERLDQRFSSAWSAEWNRAIGEVAGLDLGHRDLRRANMRSVFLVNSDLSGARLEGAALDFAHLEGAELARARLENTSLFRAHLQGTLLTGAWLVATDLRFAGLAGATLQAVRITDSSLREANLQAADLQNAEIERTSFAKARMAAADLFQVGMREVNFSQARLDEINLSYARIEDADFGLAHLTDADLTGARIDTIDLSGARMEGADLGSVRATKADLRGARMSGADLRKATMQPVTLSGARMRGADIRQARLQGEFWGAWMEGADLRRADLRSSSWMEVLLARSPAHGADLRGAGSLAQAQLDGLIGDATTLLPGRPAPNTGEPYYVWSCWAAPPQDLDALTAHTFPQWGDYRSEDDLRAEWLCPPGTKPQKTGTPLPLDAPRPAGHPLGQD